MKECVAKAQAMTTKTQECFTSVARLISEEARDVNGYGVYQARWQVIATLGAIQRAAENAREELLAASFWPTSADYDEADTDAVAAGHES